MAIKEYFVRKNLLVEKSLQFKYLVLVLFTLIGIISVFILTLYFAYWSIISPNIVSLQAQAALNIVFHKLNLFLLVEIPIALLLAAIASIIISHKVAGPVYRLQMVARQVAKGDLTQTVRLRSDDELKNLSAAFNTVIENMHLLVAKDRELICELSELTNSLYSKLKDKKIGEEETLALIRKLNDLSGELKTLILQYKIEKSKGYGNS